MSKMPDPTEHQSQSAFVHWLRLKHIKCFAVPNGAYLGANAATRAIVMRKLKEEGFDPGVPDLWIPYRTTIHSGLVIEMKRKGGRVSPEQNDWITFLSLQNWKVAVCYSADEAIEMTLHYFGGERS